ncbi:transporter substrate-binding domain-containing protein [Pseudomonas sp. R76]|uniref:transporter substrate-binding domain-containing protein n=1 Tax=Pseudomonas sp. R76 TaxID=1573711 RepID=UPI001930EEE6|nr:transporter substrate-binding domain-containing protein [Pseudomonas sp. R76]
MKLNMKTKHFSAGVFFTLLANTVYADQLQDIKSSGELICGVLGTDQPFSYMKNPLDRKIVGYDVDLCDAIAKNIGVKPVLKQLATAARIPELQQGRVDILAASLTHNKERESQISFSFSTFVVHQKAMVRKGSNINSLVQLEGKKVITTKGSTTETTIPRMIKNTTVISFDTNPQGVLALQQGKGAAYVDDDTTLTGNMLKLGADANNYLIIDEPISMEYLALGIRKGEPQFLNEVNLTLTQLEASGEGRNLYDKWFGPTSGMNFPPRTFKFNSDKID